MPCTVTALRICPRYAKKTRVMHCTNMFLLALFSNIIKILPRPHTCFWFIYLVTSLKMLLSLHQNNLHMHNQVFQLNSHIKSDKISTLTWPSYQNLYPICQCLKSQQEKLVKSIWQAHTEVKWERCNRRFHFILKSRTQKKKEKKSIQDLLDLVQDNPCEQIACIVWSKIRMSNANSTQMEEKDLHWLVPALKSSNRSTLTHRNWSVTTGQ